VTHQAGAVIWLTGLSGAGKTTVASLVVERLRSRGVWVEHLDGDVLRSQLGRPGFSRADREKYLAEVGALASRLESEGAVVVASLISPYQSSRDDIRRRCRRFVEVYVSTPLATCERRDPKGLYARARRGEIDHFTGISDPYEPPSRAAVSIDTTLVTPDEAANRILAAFGDL